MNPVGEKGSWKHCWERVGQVISSKEQGSNKLRSSQRYACKTCGAEIIAACSAKITASIWKKQGVLTCSDEIVRRVHES